MNTTSGVGELDFAFQRSSTFRSWGPYLTLARAGAGLSAAAFFLPCADDVAGCSSKAARASAIGMRRSMTVPSGCGHDAARRLPVCRGEIKREHKPTLALRV